MLVLSDTISNVSDGIWYTFNVFLPTVTQGAFQFTDPRNIHNAFKYFYRALVNSSDGMGMLAVTLFGLERVLVVYFPLQTRKIITKSFSLYVVIGACVITFIFNIAQQILVMIKMTPEFNKLFSYTV